MMSKHKKTALAAALALAALSTAQAADVTWTNGSGSFAWNATHQNWSSGAWNSGVGNEAIFGNTGAGNVIVDAGGVNVSSINFTGNGYTLGGGPINFVAGGGSLKNANGYTGALISTDPGVTATINSAITSSLPLIKMGTGTLQLAGPLTFTGPGIPYMGATAPRALPVDLVVDGISGQSNGGLLQIMGSNVLPSTTRVGLGNGQIDIGNNNVTLGSLTFLNQNDYQAYDPSVGASENGSLIGTGTLRVTGDITVIGRCCGNNGANTIGANLDLGGGTQIVRVSQNSSVMQSRALQFTGVISNGSLLKTSGMMENGIVGNADGMSLYGNNTYTGSTILNGGYNVVTGTNASSFVEITGAPNVPGGNVLVLAGANGSYHSATVLQAVAGGILTIDNTLATGGAGYDQPTVAAANNNDRLNDTAEIQLRDGAFSYVGASNTASSETFGKLNITGGHNVVNITATGTTGTSTLYASDLVMAQRSTLQISSATLGAASKLFVAGALPAADSTGILQGVIGKSDFVTYNATTGVTPLAAGAYAASFAAGAGANVALTASTNAIASSMSINALKTTGTVTNNIATGQVLNIASGMLLNTSGTTTFNGGTVDFGSSAGTFFGGTATFASTNAITGTNGLINASSTLNLNGNLSGLSGPITTNGGTTTIGTNTFAGALQVRTGTLAFSTNQTLAGQGAITIGVNQNDSNLIGTTPLLSLSGMGANSTMGRDIIVDNGGQNVAGAAYWSNMMPQLSPLSNTTGSQTLGGNLVLNSPLRLQGGGAGGTGSTNFTGNISGSSYMFIVNGRESFTGNVGNTGGMTIGSNGGKTYASFLGTTSGNAPLTIYGGSGSATVIGTSVSYAPGSLPTGDILMKNGYNGVNLTAPTLIPLATSTINNNITASQADINAQVNSGITATWNGQITTDGSGYLMKNGAGTLVLNSLTSNAAVRVNAGTLLVNGQIASQAGQGVAVNNGGVLGGTGSITSAVLVNAGGTISAGVNGVGTLGAGALEVDGLMASSLDGLAGANRINASSFTINGGSLSLSLANMPIGTLSETFLLLNNTGANAIAGSFANVLGLPTGYTYSVNYAFNGTDSFGQVGDGNDLAVTITAVPEPATYATLGAGLLLVAMRRRRQR
ncbi:MAG: PEP-CTERM sorting domain-containing protein [Paucibacter sp.]|nr:PEP-CTERM sorting domain-containing protein [Roseateles sp.]